MKQPTNYHVLHITWHGQTNTKPHRIKIKSFRFREYLWMNVPHDSNQRWDEDAIQYLQDRGFEIIGQAEYPGNGFIFISSTFKRLKDE